jgi:hypothetical protein
MLANIYVPYAPVSPRGMPVMDVAHRRVVIGRCTTRRDRFWWLIATAIHGQEKMLTRYHSVCGHDASTPPDVARHNPSIVTVLTIFFLSFFLSFLIFRVIQPFLFPNRFLRFIPCASGDLEIKTLEEDVENYSETVSLN